MNPAAANQLLRKKLLLVALSMFGFGFALAPLYKSFCELTGINRLEVAGAPPVVGEVDLLRLLTVELDANIPTGHHLGFRPLQRHVEVHPGELVHTEYEMRNDSDLPVTGQAVPSYSPPLAGRYVLKLECFCFKPQTLKPWEVRKVPLVFMVDKNLPPEVNTVTLSYTFFIEVGIAPSSG